MHHPQKANKITVMEAVEALAEAAEGESLPEVESMWLNLDLLTWHGAQYAERNRERVRESFEAILNYLKNFYEKEKASLNDLDIQRGIQAVMLLTAEAVQKMDRQAQEEGKESIAHLKEYQELQQFYQAKIAQKSRHYVVLREGWQNLWKPLAMGNVSLEDPHHLTWNVVCRDTAYELFLIRREDGTPFFDEALLRHLRLVGAFDTFFTETSGDDLFAKLQRIQERDLHETARQMIEAMKDDLESYFKEALHYKDRPLVSALNRAVMALMLAANPKHLGTEKGCTHYFADFHEYLRKVLASGEYADWDKTVPISQLRSSTYSSSFFKALVNLLYGLVSALFLRRGDVQEFPLFMQRLVEEGSKGIYRESSVKSPESIWHAISDEYTQMSGALKRHPNGPLLKSTQELSALEAGEILWGYDPFIQGNLPSYLYSLICQEQEVRCLRFPFPVRQESMGQAILVEEFKAFVQGMNGESNPQRHLMILLEEESLLNKARFETLLQFKNGPGYAKEGIVLLHLPKSGDFYTQSGPYVAVDEAGVFINSLCQRALKFSLQEHLAEVKKISEEIHQQYFGGKNLLTRKNRMDFIEIFDNYCVLKCLEIYKPDTMSFNCKDGIDTGMAASAEFYAFFKRVLGKEEIDLALWREWLYVPSLLLRHRLILPEPLDRALSALSILVLI